MDDSCLMSRCRCHTVQREITIMTLKFVGRAYIGYRSYHSAHQRKTFEERERERARDILIGADHAVLRFAAVTLKMVTLVYLAALTLSVKNRDAVLTLCLSS